MQTSNQSNLPSLLLGIGIGLALGLTIGWWLWPVHWQNGISQDLNKETKYEHVLTIAEAFSSTGDIGTALDRLSQLVGPGGDVRKLVEDVLDNLGTEDSKKRSSLLYLAAGIPPSIPVAEVAPVLVPVVATPVPTVIPQNTAGGSAEQESSALGGFLADNWVLLLTAFILLVGGGYILYRLALSSAQKRDPFGRTHNPARIPADAVGPVFPSSGRVPVPFTGAASPPPAPSTTARVTAKEPNHDADYIFHRDYKGSSSNRPAPLGSGDETYHPVGPVLDFEAEPSLDQPSPPAPSEERIVDTRRREEPERLSSRLGGLAGGLAGRISNPFGGEGGDGATPKTARSNVQFSPDQEGYFVAEFFAGDDFEIAKSINRGERGYIGEGGMAVSKLNTGSNAETATALEVWLFEKSQISTRTQHLLSPHLFKTGDWDQTKLESGDPQPLEAQKGLTFQLEGEEAVLHCRITDMEFMESGPPQSAFRHLRLEMVSEIK